MARKKVLLASSLLLAALWSCQPQRYLEDPWLRTVSVSVDGKATDEEAYTELLQLRPNTNVFGTFPYVWLYLQAKPGKTTGYANWLRRIGERPVLWDSSLAASDVEQLTLRLKQDGYFYADVSYDLKETRRGATLTYKLDRGTPTHLSQLYYVSMGPGVDAFLEDVQASSNLANGTYLLRMEQLDEERRRIASFLQEKGFYTFGPEAVHFDVDTLGHPYAATVTVRLDNWIRNSEYGTVEEPHRVWIIREARGQWPESLRLNPTGIERLPWIPAGQPFQASAVTKSTQRLRAIPAVQSGRWQFAMVQDSLNATLQLVPAQRVGLTWKGESTALSGIYGVQSSLELFDHNPFGGLEHVNVTLSGGVGAQLADTSTLFNTYFLDLETGIQWPGLWGWKDAPVSAASTRLSASVGRQYRAEFDRLALGSALQYQFTTAKGYQWDVSPIDLTYIDLRQVDSSFYQALSIKSGFQDVFLIGPRVRLVQPFKRSGRWERRAEWGFETSGILTDVLARSLYPTGADVRTIASVPYAHYLRAKVDLRWLRRGTKNRDWAFRAMAGELFTLKNTPGLPPFERAFFAGGSNDLRGWLNFRLGPGALPLAVFDSTGYLGSGTRKLLFQSEYRFPVSGALSAALFTDFGNTWLLARNLQEPASTLLQNPSIQERIQFRPRTFLAQSAWDAGLGIRYDLDFFVIRVDWGLQIYDPRRLGNQPWWVPGEWAQRSTLNFGLGMPF